MLDGTTIALVGALVFGVVFMMGVFVGSVITVHSTAGKYVTLVLVEVLLALVIFPLCWLYPGDVHESNARVASFLSVCSCRRHPVQKSIYEEKLSAEEALFN